MRSRHGLLCLSSLATLWGCALLSLSCSSGDPSEQAARVPDEVSGSWKLVLDVDGEPWEFDLETMDIYLNEDEDEPELFVIQGSGVALAGVIPAGVCVGYEEAFDRLIGRRISVRQEGGDPAEPTRSTLDWGVGARPVLDGWLQVERVTGKRAGVEGDRTLHGTIELRTAESTLRGQFAVHAVTWG